MDLSCDHLCTVITDIFQNGKSSIKEDLFKALLPLPRNPSDPVPFLQSRQQAGGRLNNGERESLNSAIKTLEKSLENPAGFRNVQQALGFEYPNDSERQLLTEQLHQRLLGLLYGVLAAAEFPEQHELNGQELPAALLTALNTCGQPSAPSCWPTWS